MLDRIRDLQGSLSRFRQRQRASTTRDPQAKEVERRVADLRRELADLDAEKADLLRRRREIQRELGPSIGRKVMPLARVEKTNGTASFVAGVRMMQRIHRRAENPAHGFDGAGAVFADRGTTERFVLSHDVPLRTTPDEGPTDRTVVVHAFHGQVGLLEVAVGGAARHLDGDLADLGDVREAVPHDGDIPLPASLGEVAAWSARLSDHVSRPYVQVVWRQDGDHLALDRLDVDPDRLPVLTEEQDERLGHLFDTGHARMLKQPYLAGALENRVPGGVFDPNEPVDPADAP
ncbi:hypothetical protein KC207_09265 [Phycicoccus sp. BSK3Z-2]|uniref:Uncharacterized protein n=1 Tax=Phycicoccus avicenniae TaxID=2828860 RepID=A0A941D9V3_9MICO|nr:hypothetical protein [Phycicoccus avicenniae]MBR7743475.1 hypothetical protein [Phycicoccus avicenniae]